MIFETPEHALRTGMLLGFLMKQGIRVEPVIDDQGNYTPQLIIWLESFDYNDEDTAQSVLVEVIAP